MLKFKTNKVIFPVLILILFLLSLNCVSALEKVVSNSADWRDVYSSMLYASIIEKGPGLFLTSSKHGPILLYSISKGVNGTLIISSKNQPYIVNYKAVMDSQGYQDVEEIITNTANLDLAKRLTNANDPNNKKIIKKFIIVDDAYGYNALSVAPYAILDNYYVLFANERNIGAIDSFLSNVNPEKILIYGQVDEPVKTRLTKYSPETINLGDRFDNNIEIVKRYQTIKHSKQTLMSNGEFIEASIMAGEDPVLFIGRGTVPLQVQEYVKNSEFQVAVLIGNELINSATTIRRQIGISVFVKFAQGARTPTGSIATVEDLDKFPMPRYALNLGIYSITYNKATNALWVTYKNNVALGTYLKGTITLNVDGQIKVVGDQDPVFIDKNQYKTLLYDVVLEGQNISAKVYTLFGEGKKSLENVLEGEFNVETVEILDDAMINMTSVTYDVNAGKFLVDIENIGIVDSYVTIEMLDLFINGEYITVSSDEPTLIKTGKSAVIPISVELSEADIENNPTIKVKAYYGERQNALIKTIYGEYEFKYTQTDFVFYGLILLAVLLLLLLFFGRKKCPHCGAKNSRFRKTCKKCGQPLYKKHSSNQHNNNQ